MRIKTLFSIPDGEKVTEKALRRVLISSICSILLCMTCLVSTTWAWFAVSIENTGNEIWIGKPKINLTVGGSEYVSGTELPGSDIALCLVHANKTDDFDKKSTLYVTLTLQSDKETTSVYTTLNESNNYSAVINIENETGKTCSVSWTVSWFAPANAIALVGNTITLEAEEPTEPSTQDVTEASQEVPTEDTTEPQAETSAEATTTAASETQPEVTTSIEPSSTESTTESTGEADSVE